MTNTPLPVNVGTPSVNINGTPTVQAIVTNTPTVNAVIQGTTAVSGSVRILSDSGTPVVVDPDGSAARNVITGSCGNVSFDVYDEAGCSMYTVPAGLNLVVENVSETIQSLNPGEYIQLAAGNGGSLACTFVGHLTPV